MTKDEVIELMQQHGYYENVEEILERSGEVKYAVSWARVSDGFKGPTVVDGSATQAFIKSAQQTLGAIAFNDLQTGKVS